MIPFSKTIRSTSGIVNVTGLNFMARGSPSGLGSVEQAASSAAHTRRDNAGRVMAWRPLPASAA